MFEAEVIRQRIVEGERYLALIDEGLSGSWHDARRQALTSGDLVLALSLVHPEHWKDFRTAQQMLGPREFRTFNMAGTRWCAAADYWGIECSTRRRSDVAIVADHSWPYSLGGPTVVGNIRWLCRRHNAVKSADVHLFPWDGLWPDWLNSHLDTLGRFIPE